MPTTPQPPHKPNHQPSPTPNAPHHPAPPDTKKPADPQEAKAKAEAHLVTPPAFTPDPALDPRAQKAPEGAFVDGMTIADEQRARSAYIEREGVAKYLEETDQRPADERTNKQVPGVTPPTKRPAP